MTSVAATWTNWVGNQSCRPSAVAAPTSEQEIAALVARAAEQGLHVRAAGGGHSFTPVVTTDGLLLDLRGLGGIRTIDAEQTDRRLRGVEPIRIVLDDLDDLPAARHEPHASNGG